MQTLPSKAMFIDSLNTGFQLILSPDEIIDLELIEIKEGHSGPNQEQFSLLFRQPGGQLLPQKLYRLRQAQLGEFDLFLVPVQSDSRGTCYEAVFNRLIKS